MNLPRGTPSSTVAEIYLQAWKSGLKGITVYVEGSRDGVLISKEEFLTKPAFKRPKELPCNIHHSTVKGQNLVFLVGLLDDKPYEVFAGLASNIEIPRNYRTGRIRKVGKGRYNLLYDDREVQDIIKTFSNDNHATLTRLVSMALRHGAEANFVVDQLVRDPNPDFQSFTRTMARVLKTYIPDNTPSTVEVSCPECGTKLTYQSGCVQCLQCGYSKCE